MIDWLGMEIFHPRDDSFNNLCLGSGRKEKLGVFYDVLLPELELQMNETMTNERPP